MTNPDISIIVPVYNVEATLGECLDSILAQTYKNIEIICVNDGSTDSSLNILNHYAKQDPRISVITKQNSGYGHTMNTGIDAASGKYIGLVESDDYILPSMYERLLKELVNHDVDFVKADYLGYTTESGYREVRLFPLTNKKEYYNRVIEPKKDKDILKESTRIGTWSGLYKAEFLKDNGIRYNETPGASYQDTSFWLITFMCAKTMLYIDEPFYIYKLDNPNSSVNNPEKVFCINDEYEFVNLYLDQYPDLKKEFIHYCYHRRFHSYVFNLRRLAMEHKLSFLHHFSEVFNIAMMEGYLDLSLFYPNQKNELKFIMNNPDSYYLLLKSRMIAKEDVENKEIPKVSVIVPVYNVDSYLDQCLESIALQTLKDIEIICIDDGSYDSSLKIMTQYAYKDKRFHAVTQKNTGAGAARNVGLTLAKGEYLSFLDSDDVFDPKMLELTYDKAIKNNIDIVIFKCDLFDDKTGERSPCAWGIRDYMLPENKSTFNRYDLSVNLFFAFNGWAWDKLFKRSFIMKYNIQYQNQRTANDMFFVFYALTLAGSITTINSVLAHQRVNITGSLSRSREKSWDCFYNALMYLKKELIKTNLYSEVEQAFVNYALRFSIWNLKTVRGNTYETLYNALKTYMFKELGIEGMPRGYFAFEDEYIQYQKIMGMSSSMYILELYDGKHNEIDLLKRELEDSYKYKEKKIKKDAEGKIKKIEKVADDKIKQTEKKADDKIKQTEKDASDRIKQIEKDANGRIKKTEKDANNRIKQMKGEISEKINKIRKEESLAAHSALIAVENSISFKVGRIITWLPRAIRSMVKK